MSINALYDERVMDHIKNARNYRALEDAHCKCEAVSQVCGDTVTVYLKLAENRIDDIGFQCESCGICMSSTSMMTELVKGKALDDVQSLVRQCAAALEGQLQDQDTNLTDAQRAVFATLQAFPARKTCAWVGWAALSGALRGDPGPLSL